MNKRKSSKKNPKLEQKDPPRKRKLKLQVQMTVDGFVAGPSGELNWMLADWDDKLKDYVSKLTDSVDTIFLGKNMTDGFINHWGNVAKDPKHPEYEAGKKFTDISKVVFSRTLKKSEWDNTSLAKGDLVIEVEKRKKKKGRDIIVYGGASFVSALTKENLIDEYYLFINPVAIGSGMTIFNNLQQIQKFTLVKSITFDCGIVLLYYLPK